MQYRPFQVNPSNRLMTELEIRNHPSGDTIKIRDSIASKLFSLCGEKENYDNSECSDKEPVLFVHGFATGKDVLSDGGLGANAGGGSDTWGKFPEILKEKGYAVFEFTWKTNSTFKDSASDLAKAIRLIQNKTHKKVHIIAHSFGGLLSRTYIQGLATDEEYDNNIQSLSTLSTPHSGIFDGRLFGDAVQEHHGVDFYGGQHSTSFEECMQSSCHQAGEDIIYDLHQSTTVYSKPSLLSPIAGPVYKISEKYGLHNEEGELPALLATNFKNNGFEFPVPVKVLKALTIDRGDFLDDCAIAKPNFNYNQVFFKDEVEGGDQLISYLGQSFYPDNTYASSNVEEKVLGMSEAVSTPGSTLGFDEAIRIVPERRIGCKETLFGDIIYYNSIYEKITFEGYRHSNSNMGQGVGLIATSKGDVGVAYVKSSTDLIIKKFGKDFNTNNPHEALTEVLLWLEQNTAEEAVPENIILNFQVVDANTQAVLSGANIDVGINYAIYSHGETDSEGAVSIELPFKATTKYVAIVSLDGYHAEEFDLGYYTGITPTASSSEFPRIYLQPDVVEKGTLGGRIIDSVTSGAISGVEVSLSTMRNDVVKTAITDSDGKYIFTDLVVGVYQVTITKEGYSDSSFYFNVQPNQTNNGDGSLRAILENQQMSIRLSWDENPSDLDSHLVKYDSSGNQLYHLYYSHKNDSTTGDNLDRDDTSSYGPETTTIESVDASAKYIFAVYHYSGSGSITSTSNAKIELNYGGHVSIPTQSAPTSGEGSWWKVFEIVSGEVIPCVSDCILDDEVSALNRSLSQTRIPSWLVDIATDSKVSK